MNVFIRQSTKQFRLWLLAAAAVLLFTSVISAGHIHGTLAENDSHCTLCQHSVSLDKPLAVASDFSIPLLLAVLAPTLIVQLRSRTILRSISIRAPPVTLPRH